MSEKIMSKRQKEIQVSRELKKLIKNIEQKMLKYLKKSIDENLPDEFLKPENEELKNLTIEKFIKNESRHI